MKTLRLALCLVLTSVTVAQAATYENAQKHFSFEYDDKIWELAPEKPLSKNPAEKGDPLLAQKTLVTLQKIKADDKYHARFSVVADSLEKFPEKGDARLVAYHKSSVDFLKKNGFSVQSTEVIKLPKVNSQAGLTIASQSNFGLTFRQVVLIHDNEAYLLTAGMRSGLYEEQLKEVKSFFDTFTFKK